jgi:hypothetical protein
MYIINEPYRFDGYWAFSAEKTYWFSGVLDYSPKKKKIELRMWGTHKSAKLDFQADTVLGLTTDGEKITLLNCIVRSNSRRIHKKNSGENTYLHIIEANKVIIGKHYENSYKIAYSYIKVRYSDQFAFIQKDGFQHDLSQKNITVAYKEPGNVILGDNKDVRIEITFYGIPSSPVLSLNKFSLTQFEYFDISFSKNHDLRILSSEINFLRYLIIFSINKDISLLECSFLEKNISDKDKYSDIYLLDNSFIKKESRDFSHQRHKNLLDLGDFIKIPDLYEKWRLICKDKESAVYKYFTTVYDDDCFLDERFHKIVMAFEDYHRNSPCFRQSIRTPKGKNRDVYLRERIDSVFIEFEKQLFYLFRDLGEQNRIISLIVGTGALFPASSSVLLFADSSVLVISYNPLLFILFLPNRNGYYSCIFTRIFQIILLECAKFGIERIAGISF